MKNYDLARKILGIDFISPEDVMRSRKAITYTEKQLTRFDETVPQQEILEWCRDNNIMLVAGPNRPMSLLEIRTMKNGYFYSKEGGWYAEQRQKFSQSDKVETKWYMIRKDIVPESTSKNWDEQHALISEIETVPNAPEFVWAITTYKAVRGTYLFGGICVRTSSLDWDGIHVFVGNFDVKGLFVSNIWDSN
jgi:hypothetical protein